MDQKKQKPTYFKTEHFDYSKQAWVGADGRYLSCAHTNDCGCYGKLHAGELAYVEEIVMPPLKGNQSERSGPETRDFVPTCWVCEEKPSTTTHQGRAVCNGCLAHFLGVDRTDFNQDIVIYRVRLVDLHVDAMKPEDAVLEIAGFSSSAEYPSVMDIAAALASDKVFRSKQSVYAMDIDEALGAALIPVALVLDPFTTRIMDFLMNPARKGGRA